MKTRLTELLKIEYPIIQGGLANLAYAELAAAVSNAGGLGQITATSLPSANHLREEILKVRQRTDKPFSVNIAISEHKSLQPFLDVVQNENVDAITLTGGNPAPALSYLESSAVKKLILVSSVRQAKKAEALGADAVIAVGQEGGGHIGRADTGTIVLVPRVVDAVNIPVVASGGIADGRGLLAGLALGAEGIEMGTRFIATKECIAHSAYKNAIVERDESETLVIKRSIGAPGRVLDSDWVQQIIKQEEEGTTSEQLHPYLTGERNRRAIIDGHMDEGFAWAGQSIGLIDSVPSVEELFDSMLATAGTLKDKMNGYGL